MRIGTPLRQPLGDWVNIRSDLRNFFDGLRALLFDVLADKVCIDQSIFSVGLRSRGLA